MLFRYLTSFAFLTLLPLGEWLGGAWTFAAAAACLFSIAGLDSILGESRLASQQPRGIASRWLPRVYILLQLGVTAWMAVRVAQSTTSLLEAAGLTLSTGLMTGIFGFVAAHEMIHSRKSRERALGLTLLGSVFYMQFRIAHVYGHHRRAATPADPATARLGEGLYTFVARSAVGQFREAWAFETKRKLGNRMIGYLAIEATFALAIAAISLRALAFFAAVAVIAIFVLESFNYVAHYGLTRRVGYDGRVERLGPRHSWNSARRMNNASLLNMGRHSDHHRRMTTSYEELKPLPGQTELPSGYASALLTALVPPLWRRVMDPRVEAVTSAEAR